ncbi:hypothetical protein EAB01_14170, partial [Listeria monocytogenes]|nr:hypothetical protein [Listeria monocytogenes]
NPIFQDEYTILTTTLENTKNALLSYLLSLTEQLEQKSNINLFNSIDLNLDDLITQANVKVKGFNDLVKSLVIKNNDLITNFDIQKKEAELKYVNHLVADYLIQEDYYKKKDRYQVTKSNLESIELEISMYNEQLQILEASKEDMTSGKQELELRIQTILNRDDLKIEMKGTDRFILTRNGQIAKRLSEGEKTAISFAYFLLTLENSFKRNTLSQAVVYIDDPISSLDSNHISQVYHLLDKFFIRKGIDPNDPKKNCLVVKQLFISTHNFEFFTFLKDSKRLTNKKLTNFYYIKRIGNTSELIKMPSSLMRFKSEYLYLYSIIKNFKENPDPENEIVLLLPNALRRFLELYTLMKLPGSDDEIDGRLDHLAQNFPQLKFLHRFSHLASLDYVARHSELLAILPDAISDLFILLNEDPVHLESLNSAVAKDRI